MEDGDLPGFQVLHGMLADVLRHPGDHLQMGLRRCAQVDQVGAAVVRRRRRSARPSATSWSTSRASVMGWISSSSARSIWRAPSCALM